VATIIQSIKQSERIPEGSSGSHGGEKRALPLEDNCP